MGLCTKEKNSFYKCNQKVQIFLNNEIEICYTIYAIMQLGVNDNDLDNNIKIQKRKRIRVQTAFISSKGRYTIFEFGIYFFSFLLTESVVNERAAEVVGIQYVNWIYAIGLLCTATGYYLFSGIYKLVHKELVKIFCAGTMLFAILTAFIQLPALYLLVAFLCLISFGYLGAYAHYLICQYSERKHFAIHISIAMAIAILLQFIVQLLSGNKPVFIIAIAISGALFALMENKVHKDNADENCQNIDEKLVVSKLAAIIIMVIIMSMILGIEDSIMVYKNATGELRLFSGIRLFYALGLIVAGLVADIRDRVILPIATVCAVMLSTLVITFLNGSTVSYNLSRGFMYFYCGFYVVYLTIMFIDIARKYNNTRLFAGMGRIVRSITTAIVVIIMTAIGNSLNHTACNVINCILSIMVILVFAAELLYDNKNKNEIANKACELQDIANKEKYESFCEFYGFTEKEKECFGQLISTEDTVQAIADGMNISRRVIQRHIASLYEKTNTQTRVGLLMEYVKFLEK